MTARPSRPAPTVDWVAAGRRAGALVPAGRAPTADEAVELVATLRSSADRARALALRAARLDAALEASGGRDRPTQVLVVDRAGWTRAAASSFRGISGERPVPGTTAQAAALLALLAGRVLGQFDPYTGGGRLVLVAPNVLRAERAMGATPADFRLWVCVHEQTHALQFAAAPWLADHVRGEVAALLADVEETPARAEAGALLAGLVRALRSPGRAQWSVLDALPAGQRERVERLTAVMSLLEGHADVTMDAATRAIPSVRALRKKMTARRTSTAPADRLVRRLLGLDAKLAQYRDGAAFVRAVRRRGGRDALDAAWASPEGLPRPGEIGDPAAWLRRVG